MFGERFYDALWAGLCSFMAGASLLESSLPAVVCSCHFEELLCFVDKPSLEKYVLYNFLSMLVATNIYIHIHHIHTRKPHTSLCVFEWPCTWTFNSIQSGLYIYIYIELNVQVHGHSHARTHVWFTMAHTHWSVPCKLLSSKRPEPHYHSQSVTCSQFVTKMNWGKKREIKQ